MSSLESIGQIALACQDTSRAKVFYRDILGLPLLFEAPGGLVFFNCGGVRLMLDPNLRPEGGCNAILYYKTADLPGTVELFSARGAVFEHPPHLIAKMPDHELWMAFVRDSEGNLIGIMSEVR